jgi:hypothetical protein
MHFRPTTLAILLGMLLMLRRRRIAASMVAHGMVAAGLARILLEESPLRQDGLASRYGSAVLANFSGRCQLFRLRLDAESEQRFGSVLPDEPDLLLTHVPEFSYLRHDRRFFPVDRSELFRLHHAPLHKPHPHRHLVRQPGKAHASRIFSDSTNLVEDHAGFDDGSPILRLSLALTHTGFERDRRDRFVGKHAHEKPALVAEVLLGRDATRLDRGGRQPSRLLGLEAEVAEDDAVPT